MAEEKQSSATRISSAIGAERQSNGASDLSRLSSTLVKSLLWKQNTFHGIETLRSANSPGPLPQEERGDQDAGRLRKALARRKEEIRAVRRELVVQAAALEERDHEIDRLRESIARLETENKRMVRDHQAELQARQVELSELQAAYDQFEQQSDELLNELDRQNERLKSECKLRNRFSVL